MLRRIPQGAEPPRAGRKIVIEPRTGQQWFMALYEAVSEDEGAAIFNRVNAVGGTTIEAAAFLQHEAEASLRWLDGLVARQKAWEAENARDA